MIEQTSVIMAIALVAGIVYLTRVCGYFVGLKVRHIPGIKPVLETLPGCAFMAILAPAMRHANLTEMLAMLFVVVVMWKTDNVALAAILDVLILLFVDPQLLSTFF